MAKILLNQRGWAFRNGGAYPEALPSHDLPRAQVVRASGEQRARNDTTGVPCKDERDRRSDEVTEADDRPNTKALDWFKFRNVAPLDLHQVFDARKRVEHRVRTENQALRNESDQSSMFEEIVGDSAPLRRVLGQMAKVARTDATVLILGETGTGKELVARAIHGASGRSTQAFIAVNCAAIPSTLISSELFGHEKGAFSGALQRRIGRFEAAERGTIFLDEVGDLPQEAQSSLLRVLQEKAFERIGSNRALRSDVRVLAATNRNLKGAVSQGTFRPDLYYRLNVFPIDVPPLRDRAEDIPLLIEHIVERFAKEAGKKVTQIEAKTLELLQAYSWPGNVRELQNVIERAIILCERETLSVDEAWVGRDGDNACGPTVSPIRSPTAQERDRIEAALEASQGKVAGPSGAAAKLGIPRQTLESQIRALRINKYKFKMP